MQAWAGKCRRRADRDGSLIVEDALRREEGTGSCVEDGDGVGITGADGIEVCGDTGAGCSIESNRGGRVRMPDVGIWGKRNGMKRGATGNKDRRKGKQREPHWNS